MTGLTNMPADTDAIGEPEGGTDDADPEGPDGADPPADAEAIGEPGGFVTAAPEQAWARTAVRSASNARDEPARRTVNP
jgi:hypothetical protein